MYGPGHVFEIKETPEDTWKAVYDELTTHYGRGGFEFVRNNNARVRIINTSICRLPPCGLVLGGKQLVFVKSMLLSLAYNTTVHSGLG